MSWKGRAIKQKEPWPSALDHPKYASDDYEVGCVACLTGAACCRKSRVELAQWAGRWGAEFPDAGDGDLSSGRTRGHNEVDSLENLTIVENRFQSTMSRFRAIFRFSRGANPPGRVYCT